MRCAASGFLASHFIKVRNTHANLAANRRVNVNTTDATTCVLAVNYFSAVFE
jgi:hypothetical protein